MPGLRATSGRAVQRESRKKEARIVRSWKSRVKVFEAALLVALLVAVSGVSGVGPGGSSAAEASGEDHPSIQRVAPGGFQTMGVTWTGID